MLSFAQIAYLLMGKMINELERLWQAAFVSELNWPGIYLP